MRKYAITLVAILTVLAGCQTTEEATSPTQASGSTITWKYNVWGKKRSFTAGIEELARVVEDKSDGNFKIKIFYGDQLGGKKQNLDNLKAGVFDAAKVCWSYHPSKVPSMTVLALPLLPLKNANIQMKVSEAVHGHPVPKQELESKWNAFSLMSSLLPQYEFMGRGAPPTTVDAWKGMKVRALGGLADAMRNLGASISNVRAADVYQQINVDEMDAVSFPFSYAHSAYKIDEVSTWYTSNMAPGSHDCSDVVSLKSWHRLPSQYQDLIMSAKSKAYAAQIEAYLSHDRRNLPRFSNNMREIRYTDSQLSQIREIAAKPVYEKWVNGYQDDFDAQSLLDFVLAEAAKASR